MSIRSTYTYVTMELSEAAHAEIKAKMLAAGYGHAVHGDTIDMHGIAVIPPAAPTRDFSAGPGDGPKNYSTFDQRQ